MKTEVLKQTEKIVRTKIEEIKKNNTNDKRKKSK